MILTRDIRFTADQIITARNACARRRTLLEKRLRRTSYEGKPGMKDRVVREVDELRQIEETFEVARKAIAHQLATHVLGDDS